MRPLERFSGSFSDVRQRLRGLPGERQAPYDWEEFRRRRSEKALIPRQSYVKWGHAAGVGAVTVLIASVAFLGHPGEEALNRRAAESAAIEAGSREEAVPVAGSAAPAGEALNRWAAGGGFVDAAEAVTSAPPGLAADERVKAARVAARAAVAAQLAALARAQGSKRWLEDQPVEPAVVRVGPRIAVANLEDRIAWVDDALTDAQFGAHNSGRMQALEQERARLVSSLAQVRYAETLAIRSP